MASAADAAKDGAAKAVDAAGDAAGAVAGAAGAAVSKLAGAADDEDSGLGWLWWLIGLAGLWLGLLGIAMAAGLARVLRSGNEIPEDYWRTLVNY